MRNLLSYYPAILLVFIVILGASCNKSTIDKMPGQPAQQLNKTFNYQDTTLDEAMLMIEENVNHDLGDGNHDFILLVLDSVQYTFTVSPIQINGQTGLTAGDQQMIRDSVKAKSAIWYSRIDTNDYTSSKLVFTDVSAWTLSGNQLTLHGNSGIGYGGTLASDKCPEGYTSLDNWIWGFDLGGCNGNPATKSDATQEMEKRMNYCKRSKCNYYSEINTLEVLAYLYSNPNDPDPRTGWYDYLLWTGIDRDCVTYPEMIYYTKSSWDLGLSLAKSNEDLITVDLEPRMLLVQPSQLWHDSFNYYGKCN